MKYSDGLARNFKNLFRNAAQKGHKIEFNNIMCFTMSIAYGAQK